MRTDPIGLDGGLNLYLYTDANPINLIDPDGKLASAPAIVIGGIVVGGAIIHHGLQQRKHSPPSGPIPPYNENKKKYKKYKQPPSLVGGGSQKQCPPPDDPCARLKRLIEGPGFKSMPTSTKWAIAFLYLIGCSGNEITGGGGGS